MLKGDLAEIARQVSNDSFKPDVIIGLTRGGLIPAVMLSHYFSIPMLPLNISLRDDVDQNSLQASAISKYFQDLSRKYNNVLVVDDILDSGATAKFLINNNENVNLKFAYLIYNEANSAKLEADYSARNINKLEDNVWIEFCFETWWKTE